MTNGLDAHKEKGSAARQSGQSLAEYGLILALVAIVALAVLIVLGNQTGLGIKRALDGFKGEAAASFSELFDDEPSLEWQQIWGSWAIENGRFSSSDRWSKAVTAVPGSDYTFSMNLQTTNSAGSNIWDVSRVLFRFQDTNNYYAVVPKTNGILELAKMQDGRWHSWLAYANTGADPMQSQNYQVTVIGERIQVWQNGVLTIDYSDPAPIPDGGIGVGNDWSEGAFDNVEITMEEQP